MAHSLLGDDDNAKRRTTTFRRRLSVFLPTDLVKAILAPRQAPHPALQLSLGLLALLSIYVVFVRTTGTTRSHQILKWGGEAKNWGDYVGLGLARPKILEQTPNNYAELGDKWTGGAGALYQSYREPGAVALVEENESTLMREGNFESDGRRGIYGGASMEWSSGVVGMGMHLGDVDMRKTIPGEPREEIKSPARTTLARHIVEQGWTFLDATDEANTVKLLAEAEASKDYSSLPLRDRVRGNEKAMAAAAERWSRIYGAEDGVGGVKSALEVVVESLVRRVPIVIFSKTTCPHSKAAKNFFRKLRLSPEPHIVEVDLRPDSVNLAGLLKRRTGHATFPNIILGGRSIGGTSDLELLDKDGELTKMFANLGIVEHGR